MAFKGGNIGRKQNPYEVDNSAEWAPKARRRRDNRRAKNGSNVPTSTHYPKVRIPRYGHTHRSTNTGYRRLGNKVYAYTECQDPDCGYQERKALI